MGKQIHDEGRREQGRRKQVRFRAGQALVETFDDWVEDSEHSSRSEALRHAMRRLMGGADTGRAPLVPPTDDRLRTAYLRLVDVANADGIVTHDLALNVLATTLGEQQQVVTRPIGDLSEMGYLRQKTNAYGGHAWKLTGWERER